MDFRWRKLRLAAWILVTGMVVAIVYHGWQGWGLGKIYPHNTFLFYPEARYGDFYDPFRVALTWEPYSNSAGGSNYFPAAYLVYIVFGWLPPTYAAILFLSLCSLGLFVLLEAVLRPFILHPGWRMLTAILFLWIYPVVTDLDRGNNEILLVLLVATFLYFYSRKKFALGFLFLFPAICFKVYPAVLLLLFCRHRLFHWCFIAVGGFFLVSWAILLTFPETLAQSYDFYLQQLAFYNKTYIMGGNGVAASGSAWNPFRIIVWLIYSHSHPEIKFGGQLPLSVARSALATYDAIVLVTLTFLSLFTLFVETSFARRAMILLLLMTVSAPGAGDYKMMYVGVVLVMLVMQKERRPWDMVVTCLLALCVLPKRECLLHFMGMSDSGKYDATIGVIVNPLCMLVSIGLLVWGGWQVAGPLRLKQRFWKLVGLFRFAGLRPLWMKPRPALQARQPRRARRERRRK